MDSLILTPSRALVLPTRIRKIGLIDLESLLPHERDWRKPRSRSGVRFASGDTLAIFGPAANQPPLTGYMTFNVRNGHLVLEATAGSTDTAIFCGVMPRNYAGGGLTVYVAWMAKTATSGTIGWDVTFERDNAANHDLDSDAWATAQTISAVTTDAASGKVTITSVAITAGAAGTDAIVAGDPFRIRIRNLAAGTATGGNQITAIEIKET